MIKQYNKVLRKPVMRSGRVEYRLASVSLQFSDQLTEFISWYGLIKTDACPGTIAPAHTGQFETLPADFQRDQLTHTKPAHMIDTGTAN